MACFFCRLWKCLATHLLGQAGDDNLRAGWNPPDVALSFYNGWCASEEFSPVVWKIVRWQRCEWWRRGGCRWRRRAEAAAMSMQCARQGPCHAMSRHRLAVYLFRSAAVSPTRKLESFGGIILLFYIIR